MMNPTHVKTSMKVLVTHVLNIKTQRNIYKSNLDKVSNKKKSKKN